MRPAAHTLLRFALAGDGVVVADAHAVAPDAGQAGCEYVDGEGVAPGLGQGPQFSGCLRGNVAATEHGVEQSAIERCEVD
jgi:hypothetical protein